MKIIKTVLIAVTALSLLISTSAISFAGGSITPSSSTSTGWTEVMKIKGTADVVSGNFETLMKYVRNGARVRIVSQLSSKQLFSNECDYIQIGNTESGQKFFECESSPVVSFDGSSLTGKFFDYVDETNGEDDWLEFFDVRFNGLGRQDHTGYGNGVSHTIYIKNAGRTLFSLDQVNYEESDTLAGSFTKLFLHRLFGGDTRLVFVNDNYPDTEQIHSFPCEQMFIGITGIGQQNLECHGTSTVWDLGRSMKSPKYTYTIQPDGEENSYYEDLVFEGAGEGRTSEWGQVGKFYFFEQK